MSAFSLEEFKSIVCEQTHTGAAAVSRDSILQADLGIDSITLVKIISRVSDVHDVIFEDIDFDGVETVGQAYDVLIKSAASEQ